MSSYKRNLADNWSANFLFYDACLVALITLLFIIWVEVFNGKQDVNELFNQNRNNVYAALVSIFGSLLGFIITTMSIITTWTGREQMDKLRRKTLYPQLWDTFYVTVQALAAAVIVSIIALIFDRDGSSKSIIWYFLLFFVLLASVRVYRCVWLLEKLIDMVAGPIEPEETVDDGVSPPAA